jgi:hypothetical protein
MLYMVIFLIYKLDPKLTIFNCKIKKKGDELSNIAPPSLVDTSRRLYLE